MQSYMKLKGLESIVVDPNYDWSRLKMVNFGFSLHLLVLDCNRLIILCRLEVETDQSEI